MYKEKLFRFAFTDIPFEELSGLLPRVLWAVFLHFSRIYRIESHMDREMWATANSRRTYRFGIEKAKLEYQFL
ncbi:hypothetical protein LEP1GSC103_3309 [Leptospira borgpetersenii serovar Javanica str. UI 09931]|uniref:Uncharacterized protein n=1 Tax=Leptospira borgpetersenii serovar Javanica str. UI 09931 TaxID=1049767 RepID=A0AAV3JDM3_LEPBO|nr:hypothetical protein C4Q31_03705 [Leptospira borgpetersenii serovar Ceylonica]EKQ90609.1 hypothetical protein LEP1GSC101_0327 [Leptospira borgpetersenii str. UI 09149]EMN57591.1 hypothetical protein LEP1GSC090_0940 [Leptospira borgpetersenii serovar Javanica str. MK146]EPG58168.1 hypothetical protein LEP1GSC103_3309 [Leptospira borgpetersenii serovar Javanica str. UI 09931]